MRLEPQFGNLLVEVEEKKEVTESGLVIPDNATFDRPQIATVTAVGPDVSMFAPGNRVIFRRFSPDEVKIEEKTFTLLDQKDVLAKVYAE